MSIENMKILVRGGGEVASAVAHRLARSGFRLCLTEVAQPIAVSRGVAFCEAIYDGEKEVDGVVAKWISSSEEIASTWRENKLPILVDSEAEIKHQLLPDVIVDAIMAKKNLGTKITDASLVIGLGPGFHAGRDVHVIVETNDSEDLGKVILSGQAEPDSPVPLNVGGLTKERVLRAPCKGLFRANREMGDMIAAGDIVAYVGEQPVKSKISGVLRALIRDGLEVSVNTKLGEVDPRCVKELYCAIRPRTRAIAGGVLEAILNRFNNS